MTGTLDAATRVEHNKDVVQRWIDQVFNARQLSAVDDLKESSYLDWTPFPNQRVDLPVSGLKETLPDFLASMPDFRFSAEHMLGEGNFVVCIGRWDGLLSGRFAGAAGDGVEVGGTRIDIFRVAGDKMVEHWGCGNELAFLQALGVLRDTDTGDRAVPGGRADDHAARARQFVEALSAERRDLGAVAGLVHPGALEHGAQAATTFALLAAFPDLTVTVNDVAIADDLVTVRWTFTGTHEGTFLGIAPTHRAVAGTVTDVMRFVDGRILESSRDWDLDAVARQL